MHQHCRCTGRHSSAFLSEGRERSITTLIIVRLDHPPFWELQIKVHRPPTQSSFRPFPPESLTTLVRFSVATGAAFLVDSQTEFNSRIDETEEQRRAGITEKLHVHGSHV